MTATHPASSAAPLLSIQDLSIALPAGGDRPYAVRNISFDINAGEILCIVGESGSGKSMSANAIMGLLPHYLRPEGGRILFDNRDLLSLDESTLRGMRGREMAMIFQEPLSALNPLLTVGEQIEEVMRVHDAYPEQERAQRVLDVLEFVGLPEPRLIRHAWPFRLSGGQRQRVMIAMALVLEPRLLIADEPTTALDVTTQAQILELIARIQRQKGMGVMFVTHDFGVVAEIADRVAVMEKGILVEEGTADQVLNRPRHPYTQRLIAAVPTQRTGGDASPAAAFSPVLHVRNLKKTYAAAGGLFHKKRVVHAVNDVSFTVGRGQTVGIVGESGSGKSTIGKCLLKLIDIDGGQMLFEGKDIAPLTEAQFRPQRRKIQMIFQDPFASLNPRHTVGRILCDGPMAGGAPRQQAEKRARELLRLVELDPSAFDRYPGEFSGGQRQRIGIARALAMDPQLIVADESVSALDVSVQAQVLKLLREVQQRLQLALIFITHDLRVASQICDHLLVMHRGKVVEQGPPTQIFDDPQDPYTRQLIAAMPGRDWDPAAAALAQAADEPALYPQPC
ncbi:ABC transporter ATP-binding protein [Bordetella bronchiseptica]|uniref:ABC transporter ATP-binding protein n=1 Tax=Bordetella bronchiseptica TaxID=518 RepID=UPI0004A197B1|nr:ABC transporter ATP-binding protein [Bordetella bronchiseptica]KAB1450441.1 ABC transporter ATP-binding protein [Bordetella bronchiseptica]KAB1575927.1 ABC transporter ATP-binding protein [Bordetella bronchiseptica]KDB62256.1 oligopeptide/dipeptide transporter, C-terminal domain protein [Bordetella bronchiseptica A1-7]KDB73656.1 oligopeptide/dipeptide transporter, C-terminal domain protein [Bordetella bronchiseptica B20-10725633]